MHLYYHGSYSHLQHATGCRPVDVLRPLTRLCMTNPQLTSLGLIRYCSVRKYTPIVSSQRSGLSKRYIHCTRVGPRSGVQLKSHAIQYKYCLPLSAVLSNSLKSSSSLNNSEISDGRDREVKLKRLLGRAMCVRSKVTLRQRLWYR